MAQDYEVFVDKFKPKKTMDDCYTPPSVYEAVLSWVREVAPIGDARIIRPFHPGGDYEKEDYSGDCVVVDNPPFSILARIVDFYLERGVRFLLFAPHLTLFTYSARPVTMVVTDREIKYHNGAVVRTAFLSNLFGDTVAMTAPGLRERLQLAQPDEAQKNLPKYSYPSALVTVSRLARLAKYGIPVSIRRDNSMKISALDSQRKIGKAIYGSGLLVSREVQDSLSLAERKAEDQKQKEMKKIKVFDLSTREENMIKSLSI